MFYHCYSDWQCKNFLKKSKIYHNIIFWDLEISCKFDRIRPSFQDNFSRPQYNFLSSSFYSTVVCSLLSQTHTQSHSLDWVTTQSFFSPLTDIFSSLHSNIFPQNSGKKFRTKNFLRWDCRGVHGKRSQRTVFYSSINCTWRSKNKFPTLSHCRFKIGRTVIRLRYTYSTLKSR